jgi:2-methylcitrate dehydratase
MWKGCASASATRSGLFAAQLASEGMTGPFEPFEGRKGLWDSALNREISLDEFGGSKQPFRIMSNTFKFYPSQIHTQAPIGLAAELHKQLDVADIKSIHIDSYHGAVSSASTEPEKWDPKTRETADHSIPYLVAVGLQDGMVSPASFTNERIQDPSLRTIINKMTIDENSDFTAKYPDEYNCKIEVQTLSGKTFTAETSFPKGHKNNPLSDSEINDKFKRLATPTITDEQCDIALGLLWDLESLETFDEIFDALVV